MALGRKGTKISKTLSMLVFGEQGCRKSSFSAEAIALTRPDGQPMRVLVIDSEFGGIDEALEMKAEQYGVDLDNTYVIYTESYTEILEILDKVKNKETLYYYNEDGSESDEEVLDADGNPFMPDFIILDGSTVVYNASSIALARLSERRNKVKAKAKGLTAEETFVAVANSNLELRDYAKLNKEYSQNLILKLISTGCHHIITARETDEKQSVKTDDDKIQSIPTGRKIPDGFKGMQYNVGTVIRLYTNELGEVEGFIDNKDRTRTFAPSTVIEEPTLLAWQTVIDKNADRKKVSFNPRFENAVEKEFEREMKECDLISSDKTNEAPLTVEQYHGLIKEAIDSLAPQNKKAVANKIKEAGLTIKYTDINDLEQLKTFYEIVTK